MTTVFIDLFPYLEGASEGQQNINTLSITSSESVAVLAASIADQMGSGGIVTIEGSNSTYLIARERINYITVT